MTPPFHICTIFAPSPHVCTPPPFHTPASCTPPLFAHPRVCNPFSPRVCTHTLLHTHFWCLHSSSPISTLSPTFQHTHTSRVISLSPVCSPTRCLHSHPAVCTLAPPFPPTLCTLTLAPARPSPPELQLPSSPAPALPRRPISVRLLGRCRNGGAQALRAAPGRCEGRWDPAGPAGAEPRGLRGVPGRLRAPPGSGSGQTPAAVLRNRWAASPRSPARSGVRAPSPSP